MKGFLLIGYNRAVAKNISTKKLEQEISSKNIEYKKSVSNNTIFDNIVSYQFFKETDKIDNIDFNPSVLVAGDIYGHLKSDNDKLLNYHEAINLVQNSKFYEEHVAFEGNACVGKVTDEKLIFQNDLEGYRKLYYFQNKDIFCISTYLPLILAGIEEKWTLRKNAVLSYICSRESKWPLTFIENIFVLPPLSRAEITKNGLEIISKTFSDFYNLEKISKQNLREQLYNNYKLIIKRKNSENTAVTLSGGYDSNCLTKLYTNVYGKNFTAVSVGFKAKHERGTNINDETVYAEKVANKHGIPFKRYFFNKDDFFNELPYFIDAIDQPGHDPSSNFLMNKHLKLDGFELVLNGMGGDANFSSKRNLLLGTTLYKFSNIINTSSISFIGKFLDYRGPFSYYKPYHNLGQANSFHDLFERSQIFRSRACTFLSQKKHLDIDNERALRINYFENLYQSAKTKQEIFYSLAVFSSPDEFHALSMAERNNIELLMPFVNTIAVLNAINGSHYNNSTNREFETSIFGGIDKELLAKSKSGFSIPYAEWIPSIADKVFEFYNDLKYFSNEDFDMQSFQIKYKNNETFRNSNFANVVVWKLLVVMEYIKRYKISIL
jgi:asparagine synthetase B (glutamine-hydrolysing)